MISIERCYDSHCHFLASAIFKGAILLDNSANLEQEFAHRPENVIYGFGWTNEWIERSGFDLKYFDKISSSKKAIFSRKDGHAIFVNSNVLDSLKLSASDLEKQFPNFIKLIGRDEQGNLNGIFYEQIAFLIWNEVLEKNPEFMRFKLLESQNIWIQNGFTHVRDMSGNINQWNQLLQLEQMGLLKIYLLQNFEHSLSQEISVTIKQALKAKSQETLHLRVGGLKIFLDGTLGSKTAAISNSYIGCHHKGHLLFSDQEVIEMTREIWASQLPVCFHVIGDEGVAQAIRVAKSLEQEGIWGQMHLEHLEICSDELIADLVERDVVVHFQPSHFLDDQHLISNLLPSIPKSWVFQWNKIGQMGIPYFFGFDSPISSLGLHRTFKGIEEAERYGIHRPIHDWTKAHSYPDKSWGSGCITTIHEMDTDFTHLKVKLN